MITRYEVIRVLSTVIGVLSLAAVVTLIVLWLNVLDLFQDYSVVVDAGSSHSKIFVYTWPADKSDGLGTTSRITQVKACDVPGGAISSIDITQTNGVKNYFDLAMTNCTNEIPSNRKGRALIFLGATAGLRLRNRTDPAYVTSLLNLTRAYFSTLGLLFLAPEYQCRIISGSEEGLSGWITTNMLTNELYVNNQPLDTYGVLDMGGASTQISFIAPGSTSERYTMSLFNTNYDVYSYSYLCYGQDQFRYIYQGKLIEKANGTTLIDDPCLQSDYNQTMAYKNIGETSCSWGRYTTPAGITSSTNITFRGTGNYTNCRALIRERFNKTCSSGSTCGFEGVYQPVPISSSLKFMSMSAFYSIFSSLAPLIPLASDSSKNYNLDLTNLTQILKTIEQLCNQPWSNLTNPDLQYRPFLCFYSNYHWSLLEIGYSMNDSNIKNFQIVRSINSNEIGWTLGYMVNQTNALEPQYRPPRVLTKAEFIGILVCFLVIFVACIIILIVSTIIYCRRQKTKEKAYY